MNRKQYRQIQRASALFADIMDCRKHIVQTLKSIAEVRKIRQQNPLSLNLPNTRSLENRYSELKDEYKQNVKKLHHLIHHPKSHEKLQLE